MHTLHYISLIVLPILLNPTRASNLDEQLTWDADLCEKVGAEYKDFDYCSEIIFCEQDEDDRRSLRGLNSDLSSSRKALHGWRLAGQEECLWPGPTIRMERGKSYGLFVKGSGVDESGGTPSFTNIHLHGLHIPGAGNGDDIRREVSETDVIFYNVTIPADHMGGTYFYHSHEHGYSYSQIKTGAFGMLIVEDGEDFGTDDAGVKSFMQNEELMVLANMAGIPGKFQSAKTHYHIEKDQWYRFRVLTVSLDSHQSSHNVKFELPLAKRKAYTADSTYQPCETRAIAHDGILRFKVPAEASEDSTYNLNGASRVDLAVKCNDEADIIVGGEPVAVVKVDGKLDGNIGTKPNPLVNGASWNSKRPYYLEDLRGQNVDITDTWTVKVGEHDINGAGFSMEQLLCNGGNPQSFKYDHVNEWTVERTMHPLHVHIHPMQVVSPEGCGSHEYGEFYDSLLFQGWRDSNQSTCLVRLRFADVGGLTAIHCHMPQHEDQGSMALINVVGGPEQPEYPRVYRCKQEPCDEPKEVPTMCAETREF